LESGKVGFPRAGYTPKAFLRAFGDKGSHKRGEKILGGGVSLISNWGPG